MYWCTVLKPPYGVPEIYIIEYIEAIVHINVGKNLLPDHIQVRLSIKITI